MHISLNLWGKINEGSIIHEKNNSHTTHHQIYTTLTLSCLLGSVLLSSSSCTVS